MISQYEKGVASRLVEATLHTSDHYWPTLAGVGADALLLLLLRANQSGSTTMLQNTGNCLSSFL